MNIADVARSQGEDQRLFDPIPLDWRGTQKVRSNPHQDLVLL
jgi:hypothetical protein